MDEENKKKFKMKFYYLAVELNVVILLCALSLMAFFIGPGQYRFPLALILIIMGFLLSLHFRKKYKETKAWLDEHSEKVKET
jgi:FtsH-binding integral membrane protein